MSTKTITQDAKANTIQPANKSVSLTNYETVKKWLTKGSARDGFMEVLGEKYAPRFIQTVLLSMKNTAALQKCDPITIVRSAMVSAVTGLSIDGNFGQSALIPYKDQCTFQIMKRGLEQLALRTGTIQSFQEAIVYEGDILSHNPFTGEFVYNQEPHPREIAIGYMSYVKLLAGFEKYQYMTIEECQQWGRRYSSTFDNPRGMWSTNFSIMAQKTVTKRLLKDGAIIDPYASEPMTQLSLGIKYDQATPTSDVIALHGEVEYPDAQTSDAVIIKELGL